MAKKSSYKTQWDLKLLYTSEKDPKIEADVRRVELACETFESVYRPSTELPKDALLLRALQDYEKLIDEISGSKPYMYFAYRKAKNGSDKVANSALMKLQDRYAKAHNRILFFEIALGKLPEEEKSRLLQEPLFKPYQYYLTRVFEEASYRLTEETEQALRLMQLPAFGMWVDATERVLSKRSVPFRKRRIPLPEAQNSMSDLPRKDRLLLQKELNAVYKNIAEFAEDEMNAVVTAKKVQDELRGFKTPLDATILEYENDTASVMAMVDAVRASYALGHRFYRAKAKLLGLKKLSYADKAASIGKIKRTFAFPDALLLVADAFSNAKPEYAALLQQFAQNGQIDVFPKQGKEGGAFCSSSHNTPTFILLNHVNNLDSVSTLAHEMGHAIHSFLSETQPPLYMHYTISTAEIASTFFENLAFDAIMQTLSEKEQAIALHDKLAGDIGAVFRQIAFFSFEEELHERIREEGRLDGERMALLFKKHSEKQFGPAVRMEKEDGYAFVAISHFRRFFYVYTYAYGNLVSKVLLKRYKEDPAFIEQVDAFLRSGRSDTPENLLKKIGIDPTRKEFWQEGLKMIERDLVRLEKLAQKVRVPRSK